MTLKITWLKLKFLTSIHYWRTQNGAEVDFVVNYGNRIVPYEVKYVSYKKPVISRSLRSFIRKYSPPEAYVVDLSLTGSIKIGETEVKFVRWWEV